MVLVLQNQVPNHYPAIEIPFAPKGRFAGNAVLALARWARAEARRLVIFVHGYSGEAEATWRNFNMFLPHEAQLADTDIVFFQYDAVFNQVGISASYLLELLDPLLTSPADLVNRSVGESIRDSGLQYDRIVIVGHSTGAVVARQALLDALDGPNAETYHDAPIRLVFYAPAHCGAHVSSLVELAMFGRALGLAALALSASYVSPLLRELSPEKSGVLKRLADKTQQLLKNNGPRQLLVAHDVLRAQNDRVVVDCRFCDDPNPRPLGGENHTSVCKPKNVGDEKYQRLVKAIVQ